MTTVFIAGSISISRLDAKVKQRIATIAASDLDVVVGDADGADTSIQACLAENDALRVTVYCSGDEPRNNVGGWPVKSVHPKAAPGSRAYFTAKDLEMAHFSDVGLMIWDSKSTGTLSNVVELLDRDKKSVVFVNKMKDFVTVGDVAGLQHLLTMMSDHARAKAEDKIGLGARLQGLSQKQLSLAI
ncbi:hypothetical protein [Rhodopseudomonas pseudopalustris]|uniref:Uncharacterized protein n=1 Tax=Rhodopseudomonas pseudopalustris TaxID=1513892 RepID=A0A1H8S4E0_9BRAD|nr:hypothetical protein [Rhodopseudomonas pseudopalustris]SEO73284.1 hypothetical protein SAMN05444123_104252 [Rhodopseudomonas pseudopalustris]